MVVVVLDDEVVVVAPGMVVVVLVAPEVVVVVVGGRHVGTVTLLDCIVTAPVRASKRPCTLAPVFAVIDAWAMMVPTNVELLPRVAELPTCQKTLQAWTWPASTTALADAVISVDSAWKMKTSSAPPVSVSVPVSWNDPAW
jgi:hypothetical protein